MKNACRAWSKKENKFYYFVGVFNRRPYIERSTFVQYESCPEYIGLEDCERLLDRKDIKGNDIYEGDVIKGTLIDEDDPLRISGVIVYDPYFSFFGIKNDAGITGLFHVDNIEIVGNIHQSENKGVK